MAKPSAPANVKKSATAAKPKSLVKKTPAKAKKPAKPRVNAGLNKIAQAERVKAFVEAYLSNGQNAKHAAIKIGLSEKTAQGQASRMLKRPAVQAELRLRQKSLQNKLEVSTENVLRELSRLSFFDPRKFFNDDGTLKPLSELDDDTAAALAGMEVVEEYTGRGESRKLSGYTKKYKLPDKGANLERLARHLGLFEKDNRQRGGLLGELPRETVKMIVDRLKGIASRPAGVARRT